MNFKGKYGGLLLFSCFLIGKLYAQEMEHQILTVDSLLARTERNSKQLTVSRQEIGVSKKSTEIAKQLRQPNVGATLSLGYISNAQVWDSHLNYESTASLPHFSDAISLAASWSKSYGTNESDRII